ncbi:MAG: ECF transporter S component [Phoenicibacter congonensis]|uniref:ECF transporter S component n=1 Tax=Phoenicibacter congonensis TaxID=1944646 RepID=A0AA43UB09_9ACTN|nr:ECF transporter S component [Phoenicibacter congonensis]
MKNALIKIAEPLILIAVPAVLLICAIFQTESSAFLTFAVAIGGVALFFLGFENSTPHLRQIMPTAVLGAIAAAGRILFAPIPDFKPVSAICIISGIIFGRRSGFMVGALAALVSNFFFGQGPWTPWQMYSWGLIGYVAGVLNDMGAFEHKPVLYVYAFLSPLGYGFILNSWYIIGWVHPITWQTALAAYAAGLPLDFIHSVATVTFLAILYEPWKRKLIRIKEKFALM